MAEGLLALTWNNHSSTFCKTISSLRAKERYTDVTITCEGKFYQVHKFVLATCSEYFEKIFQETPCKHPVIVLRDVSCDELEALLNYMYIGSVSVAQSDLSRLIKVAELFQIKGLAVPDDPPKGSDVESHGTNNESRDGYEGYYRGKGRDFTGSSPRRKEKHSRSDDGDVTGPRAKRVRSFENAAVLQDKIDDSSDPSSAEQALPFEVHVKQEIQDVDSGSEGQESRIEAPFVPKTETIDLPEDDTSLGEDNSHLAPPYIPGGSSQDIPPDEQSLTQPGQEQHSFPDELLALPGPSDAQEWYSEGESSSGLPGVKGGIGNQNQEMLPMEASQQQQSQRLNDSSRQQTLIAITKNSSLSTAAIVKERPSFDVKVHCHKSSISFSQPAEPKQEDPAIDIQVEPIPEYVAESNQEYVAMDTQSMSSSMGHSSADDLVVYPTAQDTPQEITYEIISDSSKRGPSGLADSLGYSYKVNRVGHNTTFWQCVVQNGNIRCPATVRQTGISYERGVWWHTHEASLMDTTAVDPIAQDITYEIISGGSRRGKPKLIDNLGYSYNVKRVGQKTTIWQCVIRNRNIKCPATVRQSGNRFDLDKWHIHPAVRWRATSSYLDSSSIPGDA